MNALFFALLLTVAGPEVSTPVHSLGDYALVPLRDGFVMAWSQGPRVYAERLDGNLQPIAAPFSFPLIVPTSVTSLALAADSTNVLVVWHEQRGGSEAVYAAILDADVQSMLYGPAFLTMGTQPAVAAVKNGKYRVVAAAQLWTLDNRLGIEPFESIEPVAELVSVTLSSSGEGGTASQKRTSHCDAGGFSPAFFWQSCQFEEAVTYRAPAGVKTFGYQWTVTQTGPGPVKVTGTDPVLQPPAIAPNGDGFIGTLVASDGVFVFDVRNGGRLWALGRLPGAPPLAAGGNGGDVAVVWRDTALRLVMLHSDGTMSSPMMLSEDGYGAKVVADGSNQFVVLYRSAGGGDVLTARIIRSQPPRSRAVR